MKFWLLLLSMIISSITYAQSPNSFKYQATARNSQGALVINQEISMRVSIIHDNPSGDVVYQEIFSTTTNSLGLININIGEGDSNDDFSQIQWSDGSFFIKIEMDIDGGSNYQDFGTSQLLSVPYALYSNTSGSSKYTFNPTSPSGFQDITPLTVNVDVNDTYTVPSNKILYILNIFSKSSFDIDTEIKINNHTIAQGKWNIGGCSGANDCSQVLVQPIIANEGDVLSTNTNSPNNFSYVINGYLIDK